MIVPEVAKFIHHKEVRSPNERLVVSPKNHVSLVGIPGFLVVSIVALSLAAPGATAQVQFSGPTDYPVGTAPGTVAVGDFNGDGKLDIAVINTGSGDVSILVGNGDGTFQPAVNSSASGSPAFLAVGDLNGDGKLDLAVANGSANTVSVLLGNGDGTFQAPMQYSLGASADFVAIADFNGDGKLDLLASSGGTVGTVSILLGNGDATFQPAVITSVPASKGVVSPFVAVADFNGDGHLDVAAVQASTSIELFGGSLIVLLGKGDGTFQPEATFSIDLFRASNVVTGDFNRDGKADLAVSARNGIFIVLGNGDGTFSSAPRIGFEDSSLVVADLNSDGNLDLIALNTDYVFPSYQSTTEWGLGNGDGTFQGPVGNVNPCIQSSGCLLLSFVPSWLAVGDFNGDKLPDLVIVNPSGNGVSIFLNTTPTFTLSLTVAGNGGGTVTSQPEVINCKTSCAGNFAPGTAVTLTAAANATSNFTGWSGACSGSGTGTCSLAINAAASATATFSLQDFSLAPVSTTLTAQRGGQVTDAITIAPQNGSFASAIQLSCAVSGPSPIPICALSAASVTPGANSAASTLTITAPAAAAMLVPSSHRQLGKPLLAIWLPLMFGITVVGSSKKLRRRYWVLCGLLMLMLFLQTACGGSNSSSGGGTPSPTNYTVTVTGTSGTIQHTTQVTVTVQ